jgi:hypothetical protein
VKSTVPLGPVAAKVASARGFLRPTSCPLDISAAMTSRRAVHSAILTSSVVHTASFGALPVNAASAISLTRSRRMLILSAMNGRTRKITVNVPVRVLENAVKITGKGVTLTVIEGLEELDRRAKRSALRALRGKVRFELDLEETRR